MVLEAHVGKAMRFLIHIDLGVWPRLSISIRDSLLDEVEFIVHESMHVAFFLTYISIRSGPKFFSSRESGCAS